MQPGFRDSRRPYAIVIDLVARQGLLTARILARHDIPVIAITGDPKHYHCRTRVCEEILSANTGNEELTADREQKHEGVKYVHLRKDFQSALHYWRQGELTLREWWQSRRGRKMHVLFSWTDPGPFLGDLLRAIRLFLSSQERKKRLSKPPM
jgi:hypothetical protein